jgi:hypothetical protein
METKHTKTVLVEVLQRGSAAAAEAVAIMRATEMNPGGTAVAARFSYAHPAHAPGSRWVGVEVDVELTVLAA